MIASERPAAPVLFVLFAVACGTAKDPGVLQPQLRDGGAIVDARDGGTDSRDGGEPAHDAGVVIDAGVELGLRDRLLQIDGLDVEEIFAPIPGTRAFALKLRQPEDHDNPDGVWFKQRLILVHKSDEAPMVLSTTGYGLFGVPQRFAEWLSEPAAALDANQLTVEHRFFGESIARNATWRHLNVEQSANDSHRIVALLSQIYTGPWVGTGVSKGGMTAIFHHRFFPDDLAAIVPYVAPISFGMGDVRYLDFLNQIGPADGACRDRVKDVSVEAIERRAELADYFIANEPGAQLLRPDVLEAVVTLPTFGFHWTFWQYVGSPSSCAVVPARGGRIEMLALWFPFRAEYAFGFGGFDPEVGPYSFQVMNELGSQAIDYSYLQVAASQVDYSVLPQFPQDPLPWGRDPGFDPAPMVEVDRYLREEARHVLGVYGAWDPWTGGIIRVDEANDSAVVIVPEIGHGAQLSMLPPEEQDEALDRLSTWIGRSALVAPDWTRARARMRDHQEGHQILVDLIRSNRL